MLILVAYDVSTETSEGQRRLRRVAKVCLNYGQRVQKSVFECRVDQMHFEELQRRLLKEISEEEDNLRFYRLTEPLERNGSRLSPYYMYSPWRGVASGERFGYLTAPMSWLSCS